MSETACLEATPASPADRPTAVDSEGWLYDTETGEVLGLAAVADAFKVDSRAAADFALKIRSEIEGEIAGIDARLRAVTDQLQARRAAAIRRLSWWEWRFGGQLVAFARSLLNGRARTVQFDWGRVSFRRTAGTTQITDMAAAVEFVATYAPEQVRVVRTVTLAAVREAAAVAEQATGEADDRPPFLSSTGPAESVTVTTGIEIEKGDR